jgi:uncharacterized protein YyaL (SSP411 family)
MDEAAAETLVEWREWGADALAEARNSERPVLLALTASWCGRCREMDAGAFSDPGVAANVNDGFVSVRVDVDREPRVRERYNVGAFPSTVFVTPDGDVISGTTYLDADGLRQVLAKVRERWRASGADAGRVPRALRDDEPPTGEVTAEIERLVAGQVGEQFDDAHGGWGEDAKFPLPATVRFALKRDRERALGTLTAVREHLQDEDGGFFRYAAGRDWSDPAREKLLSPNASLLRAFADAYLYTGEAEHREAAEQAVGYLTGTLWTREARSASERTSGDEPRAGEAFGGSQAPPADALPEGMAVGDGAAGEPAVDATAFADGNALAADALLALAAYTDGERARRYAERTLDYLGERLVADGKVAHFSGSDECCLLADQAAVARAFATAAQVLGPEYLGVARAVADEAIDRLHDPDSGAFVDGPPGGPGLLDRPLRPVDDNAAMANALVDLHALTDDDRYRGVARDAVGAFAGAADRMGVQVAEYATAAARVVTPPLRVAVATDPGSDLHRAALRVADHEKVVVPRADDLLDHSLDAGRAYVLDESGPSDPAETPEELAALVADAVA